MSDNSNIDPHSALTNLWPSDTQESKKLAEEKQIKHQNLIDLGAQFKQAREALGYNISDLDEHTGLSFTELEAIEQGLFQHIEQQDYADYYIHTYAALLSLDADQILANFRQSYYQAETPPSDDEPIIDQADDGEINIHDEAQYEDAFTDEARETLEALNASGIDTLKAAKQPDATPPPEVSVQQAQHIPISETPAPEISTSEAQTPEAQTPEIKGLQADTNHEPITSNPSSKPFPWLKLILSFIAVLIVAGGAYFANLEFGLGQTTNQTTENAANLTDSNINIVKDSDRVPEGQKAKKVGTLESKIITQGSDDLNAPTATMVQKPLILIDQTATDTLNQAAENIGDIITDTTKVATATDAPPTDIINETIETASEATRKTINDDLAKANELAKAAEATKVATAAAAEQAAKQAADKLAETNIDSAQLPEDPVQEALAQLPTDTAKYSLHASENSWVLIEDDAAQILFSGELTSEKIFTLPKIAGVIISLGDAGVIDVYKGKQLLGKLGAIDETLDLVSVEQRFNQISN